MAEEEDFTPTAVAVLSLVVPVVMVVKVAKGLSMEEQEAGLGTTMLSEGLVVGVEHMVMVEGQGVVVGIQGVLLGIIIAIPVGEVEGRTTAALTSKIHVVLMTRDMDMF